MSLEAVDKGGSVPTLADVEAQFRYPYLDRARLPLFPVVFEVRLGFETLASQGTSDTVLITAIYFTSSVVANRCRMQAVVIQDVRYVRYASDVTKAKAEVQVLT